MVELDRDTVLKVLALAVLAEKADHHLKYMQIYERLKKITERLI